MIITVTKAVGSKCERCWRIVPLLCNLGICERCVEACQEDGWIEPVSQSESDWADLEKRGKFRLTAKAVAAGV